jgi:hypothetical protein
MSVGSLEYGVNGRRKLVYGLNGRFDFSNRTLRERPIVCCFFASKLQRNCRYFDVQKTQKMSVAACTFEYFQLLGPCNLLRKEPEYWKPFDVQNTQLFGWID